MNKKIIILPLLILTSLAFIYGVWSEEPDLGPNTKGGWLAEIYDEEYMEFDQEYALGYLKQHDYFRDIIFETAWDQLDFKIRMGNVEENYPGIILNNGARYAFHLVYCNEVERKCNFRINGVPTPVMKTGDKFMIADNVFIHIENIETNKCNNHRFCHFGFEGYHEVDVRVEVEQ